MIILKVSKKRSCACAWTTRVLGSLTRFRSKTFSHIFKLSNTKLGLWSYIICPIINSSIIFMTCWTCWNYFFSFPFGIASNSYFTVNDLRSNRWRYSVWKVVFRNFAKFTGKHLCHRLFFNKVVGVRAATLLKKRVWRRCFSVNFEKFLKTAFLQNTSGRRLLYLEDWRKI